MIANVEPFLASPGGVLAAMVEFGRPGSVPEATGYTQSCIARTA